MAQKLETFEDFVRVAKAFADPNAKPFQYEVQSFGFCKKCEDVVAYGGQYGPEYSFEKCLNPKCFEQASGPPGRFQGVVLKDDMVPAARKDEVDRLHSREQQFSFFLERFEAFVKEYEIERIRTKRRAETMERNLVAARAIIARMRLP